MRLREKLIIILLVIALIPVLCLGVVISFSFQTAMKASFRNAFLALASVQEARVKEAVDKHLVKVLLVTGRTRLRELIEAQSLKEEPEKAAEITRILTDALKSGGLQEISVLDPTGRVIASTEPSEMGKDYSKDRFFRRGKEGCAVDDIVSDGKGRLALVLSGPFLMKGRLIGVALIRGSAGDIAAIAGDYTGLGETGETTLAKKDSNGDALFITPLRFNRDAAMKLRISREKRTVPIVRALTGEELFIESAPDYRGKEVIAATHFVPETGWGVVVKMDRAEALGPLWRVKAIIGGGILLLSGVIMAFTWFFSGRLTRPVMRLTDAAEGIRKGDFSQRIAISSKDEIGLLSAAFNEMAEVLSSARKELDSRIGSLERLEEELRRTGAYNRSLIEASLDPLVTISAEGKITDVNEATIAVTGVPRYQLIGTDFSDYFTEPEKAREGYRQVFEKGFVTDYPLTIRRSDGSLTEVLYNASVYRDEAGSVLGVFAAARDVTESRRMMAELAETKNFLNNILQSSTKYSIIGKDLNNTILSWNEGARLNYGYAEEEILGKKSSILHIPEDLDSGAVDALLKTAFEKGLAEGEFRRVRKDGSRFDATVVVMRRNDSSGSPIGYLLMSTDITEKKLAEERLRYASRYARSLIEASLDPLVTISPEGKISDVNRATEEVTGYDRTHLVGTDFSDYFTEPMRAQQGYQKVFRDGAVKDYPLEIRHREGHITPVLYNASLFRDEEGNVMGVFAAARDVTERKQLEEELRRTGSYNRSLIEASLDPLVTISAEGKITDVNSATEEVTGYGRADLVGTDFSEYFTEPLKAQQGYRKVFREGTVKDYPLEIRHRDGHTTPVLYNASLFRDETGGIKGVFAAARTLDAILRVSEKRLRDITHALGEGIFVLNEKGELIFVNPEAERLLGWTEAELKGSYTHDLIHCHVKAELCPIMGIFSTGEMQSSEADSFCRKNGDRFPVSYIASPIWEDSSVVAVVTAFHDITERKSLEERLKKYTGELERSNRELEQFAYVSSHDLQEPLRRITSFTELLAKKYRGRLDEKADTYIEFIKGGTARMGVLINDLLAYSRLSTRAKEFAPTDACALVERVLADLSLQIEESGALITYDHLPEVTADDTQLRSLFQNLINNAIKFRGTEPPMVHISFASVPEFLSRKPGVAQPVLEHLREMKKGWVFSVKDNGIGIAPSYHERIFQVFQRLHTEQEYPGTGIGLAICRKVVERHGGRIWLESEAGKGTTFLFSIPER